MTLRDVVVRLSAAGIESAEYDAMRLVERFGTNAGKSIPLTQIAAESDRDYADESLAAAVARRANREPLQYILGEWDFWRQTYRVAPGCLIPRADTELLVEYAVKQLPKNGRFLDLCTGSGCIAISTLATRPDCRADAVDFYDVPLSLAAENAVRCGVDDRLCVRRGDVLSGEGAVGRYDMIISNPPYIVAEVVPTLAPELAHEPASALDGGDDGMMFYRAILQHYRTYLAPAGCFVLEIGYDQAEPIAALANMAGMTCSVRRDLGGCDRMAILTGTT